MWNMRREKERERERERENGKQTIGNRNIFDSNHETQNAKMLRSEILMNLLLQETLFSCGKIYSTYKNKYFRNFNKM